MQRRHTLSSYSKSTSKSKSEKGDYSKKLIYRGYSNFLLHMAFISPSEVENICIS